MVIKSKFAINSLLIHFFLCIFIIFIPMKTSIYQISFVLLVLCFLSHLYLYQNFMTLKKLFTLYKDIFVSFFIVVLSMVISNVLSDHANVNSWKAIFYYITRYFLLFIMLLYFYKENIITKKSLLIYILLSLLIQAIDGVYQAIFSYDIIKHNVGSLALGLQAATYNRNVFGFFMAIGLVLSTILIQNGAYLKKYHQIIIYFTLPLYLFTLFFSFSRGSWVLYITFFILFTLLNIKTISKKYLFFVLIVLSITIICFISIDSLGNRFNSLIAMESSNRFTIWSDAITLIKQKYWFGYGISTYHLLTKIKISSIHNSILEILFSVGIIGFFAFSYLLFLVLKESLTKNIKVLFPIFISFIIMTQFTHGVLEGMSTLSAFSIFGFFVFSTRLDDLNMSST